ncbi:MAG: ATP-dependent DNA helicase PcrA [Verrucomicrobia subdivision 3 bacterium]|nr:ATP-dependent DNA helicase PcrA [Limisphaerales bacterium]MCS1417665.1 ATP-dependent DNA helicase PcrA [Limisphaerales bacterium]
MAHALNSEQNIAVCTIGGPVLILAGAGTGKTRVITHRIARMISKGIPPENILAVTFTNKAAREMQGRVTKILPRRRRRDQEDQEAKPKRPTICTFHSLGVRILRQHINVLGHKRNFVIYSESDQLGAIKKILSHIATGEEKTDPAAILSLLSRYRNGGEQTDVTFADAKVRAMTERIEERYAATLKACNAIDFDDLILLTLKLLREHPKVLEACRRQYRYVMVDEYQDTNAKQFELVRLLTEEHRNLCVVGDDDQSIYSWRGAEIANLLNFEKYYPEVKLVKLEQNYRSTNAILKAANALIRNNARRKPKSLWSENGYGNRIQLATYADEEEEAKRVVEEIEFRRLAQKTPWADQAILFRTNQQSRTLETALRAAKVRYRLVGGQSFFDRREIRDFVAYLKTVLNPNDDISLLRIANVPARGISDKTAQVLLALSQEHRCSVFQVMRQAGHRSDLSRPAKRGIAELGQLIEHAREDIENNPIQLSDWAQRLLDQTQ